MAYKKLKIICDADDVLISCNAYANLFGSFLRQENRFTTSKSRSLIVSMADGGFVKNTAPLPKYGSR